MKQLTVVPYNNRYLL